MVLQVFYLGAMVKEWRFAIAAACRAFQWPAWGSFQRNIYIFPLLTLGPCFNVCSLLTLYFGVNEYLVQQRWRCVQ